MKKLISLVGLILTGFGCSSKKHDANDYDKILFLKEKYPYAKAIAKVTMDQNNGGYYMDDGFCVVDSSGNVNVYYVDSDKVIFKLIPVYNNGANRK